MATMKIDKKALWLEKSKTLKAWEIKLIELRNEGFDYNSIRDILKKEFKAYATKFVDNNKVRHLLYHKGRLHEAYQIYADMSAEESFKLGQEIIKNAHSRASMVMVNLLKKETPDHVRFASAKDILDRNAGKATAVLELRDTQELDDLRDKINKMTQPNANTKRIADRIKNTKVGAEKG